MLRSSLFAKPSQLMLGEVLWTQKALSPRRWRRSFSRARVTLSSRLMWVTCKYFHSSTATTRRRLRRLQPCTPFCRRVVFQPTNRSAPATKTSFLSSPNCARSSLETFSPSLTRMVERAKSTVPKSALPWSQNHPWKNFVKKIGLRRSTVPCRASKTKLGWTRYAKRMEKLAGSLSQATSVLRLWNRSILIHVTELTSQSKIDLSKFRRPKIIYLSSMHFIKFKIKFTRKTFYIL